MKITKQRLKEIIREELSRALTEDAPDPQVVAQYLVDGLDSTIHPVLEDWAPEDYEKATKLIATRLINGDKLPASVRSIARDLREPREFPMGEGDGPEEFARRVFDYDAY